MYLECVSFSVKEITTRAVANNEPNPWPGFQGTHEYTGMGRVFEFHFSLSLL